MMPAVQARGSGEMMRDIGLAESGAAESLGR